MIMAQRKTNSHRIPRNAINNGPKGQKFSIQVIAFVFFPLSILVLIVAIGSTSLHQNAMRSLVGERDERAVKTVANAINAQLLHRVDLIQSLIIRGRESASLNQVLESSAFLDQEFDMGLAYLTPEGTVIAGRGDITNWETLIETLQFPLNEVETDLGSSVRFTNAIPFPSSDSYIVVIYAGSGPSGPIVVGAFTVASIAHQPLFNAFDPDGQTTTILVDSNQEIIYSSGDTIPEHINAEHPGVIEALAGESGAAYLSVSGSEHVTAYSSIPLVNWGVVIEEPWESVTNPLLNTTLLAPLALVPVLILAMIAVWFGARRIVQPLQSLEEQAAKLAWGDFNAIEVPVEGIEEINRLQRTLIHMAHKVKFAQQALRGYISAITTGQEEERLRLARELHDDTIQSLIALKQRLHLTGMSHPDQDGRDQLQELQEMTDETIRDLRRITKDLRPLYLEDLGLVTALELLSRETSNTIDIPVNFQVIGAERRFPSEVELTLYRMAQEGLSNISRHAKATSASLIMQFNPQTTVLIISDDGQGFILPESPAEFAPSGHFGLLSLHERADLINAILEIQAMPHQGTRLIITLPFIEDEISLEADT